MPTVEAQFPDPVLHPVTVTLAANGTSRIALDVGPHSFAWRAFCYSATGAFAVQFSDHKDRNLSNARIASANFSNDPAAPTVWDNDIIIPAKGLVTLDFLDTSAAANIIEFVLIGAQTR